VQALRIIGALSLALGLVTPLQAGEKIKFSGKGERPFAPQNRVLPGVDVRGTMGGRPPGIEGVSMPAQPQKEEALPLTKREREELDQRENWMFQSKQSSTNRMILPEERDLADREQSAKELNGKDDRPQPTLERYLEDRAKTSQKERTNAMHQAMQKIARNESANLEGSGAKPSSGSEAKGEPGFAGNAPVRMRLVESSRFNLGSRDSVDAPFNSQGGTSQPVGILDFLNPQRNRSAGMAGSSVLPAPIDSASQNRPLNGGRGPSLDGRGSLFGAPAAAPSLAPLPGTPIPGQTEPARMERKPTVFEIPRRKF
jgi:hypothetical protein